MRYSIDRTALYVLLAGFFCAGASVGFLVGVLVLA